jgi:hypothetical protein
MPRPPFESPATSRKAWRPAARTAGAAVLAAFATLVAAGCHDADEASAANAPSGSSRVVETPAPSTASDGAATIAQAQAPAAAVAPPALAEAHTPAPADPSSGPAAEAAAAPAAAQLADVETRLDRMITDAARCTGDGECRSVAVGGKACGGPTGYRAYSANGADPKAVETLASQERELALAAARATGRVSNCLMLADPGARCEQGRCVTGGPSPQSPATR